jgi:hypothetical protein
LGKGMLKNLFPAIQVFIKINEDVVFK